MTTILPNQDIDEKRSSINKEVPALASCTTYTYTDDILTRQARRRTDMVMLPILSLAVMLQFQDKFCLGYANSMGMKKDIGMSGSEYSWAGSIFYFGYLACQPVVTWLLQRFSIIHYLSVSCFIWGVIMCAHAASHGPASMLALRFLLGFFEGGLIPCTTLLTARFYTKQQIVLRSAILQCMNGVSIFFGAPMAYGLLHHTGLVIQSWRVMFLILGGLTVALSLAIALVLSSSPDRARFLQAEQRTALAELIRTTSVDASQGKGNPRQQTIEAILDPRLYLLWFLQFAISITNGGITVFSTTLIASFGFNVGQSILLTMPSGAIQVIGVLVYGGMFRLTGTRAAGALFCLCLSVLGAGLVVGCIGNQGASMAGILLVVFYIPTLAACVAYIATNVGGHTKRVIFATSFQVAYAAGNIIGPQTYRPEDAPRYVPAQIAILVTLAGSLVLLSTITFFHWRWNQQRDRAAALEGDKQDVRVEGLTDMQDKSFRYVY